MYVTQNFTHSEDPKCAKCPPPVLWYSHLAPLGSRYHNDTFLAKVAGVPPHLNPVTSPYLTDLQSLMSLA